MAVWIRNPLERHSNMRLIHTLLTFLALAFAGGGVHASSHRHFADAIESAMAPGSQTVPGTGTIEFAFSPNEGAEQLEVKAINSSKREIRMMAYSFTSAPVVRALLQARNRGVDIKLVADSKANTAEDRSGKARAALGALVNAGVQVRLVDVFAIAHDKVTVIDGEHTETGSFNYTAAAASRNSENVMVVWNNPQLAQGYLKHWERNWRLGHDWHTEY